MSGYSRAGAPVGGMDTPLVINWNIVWTVITTIFVAVGVIIVAVFASRPVTADSITRFSFKATADQVVGGPGESGGGYLKGTFELDTESNLMKLYSYFPLVNMSQITSVLIMGPVAAGEETGPEYFSICGAPNLVNVCDVLTVPGLLEQTVNQLQPGAEATRPAILAIRGQPCPHYYIEVRTANFPTSPGALRADLCSTVGIP